MWQFCPSSPPSVDFSACMLNAFILAAIYYKSNVQKPAHMEAGVPTVHSGGGSTTSTPYHIFSTRITVNMERKIFHSKANTLLRIFQVVEWLIGIGGSPLHFKHLLDANS